MDPLELIASYDQNQVMGELTSALPNQVEHLFRQAQQELIAQLDQAKTKARQTQSVVSLDASRLSGVNEGDAWLVQPDGTVRRELAKYPGVELQLQHPTAGSDSHDYCRDLAQIRPLFARAAYNGLWAPSGTNWQPIRCLELEAEEVACLTGRPIQSCGLLVLARAQYDSILGDVARLCGIEQASHAESIDLGIWMLVAEQTAVAHGWRLQSLSIEESRRMEAVQITTSILKKRIENSQGTPSSSACEILASMERNDHLPALVLLPFGNSVLKPDITQPGSLSSSSFDRLIEARSTQRVASPVVDLDSEVLRKLWQGALLHLDAKSREAIHFPIFHWKEEIPRRIGLAMHEGIEGSDTVVGLLARAELASLKRHLCQCQASLVPEALRQWTLLPDSALEDTAGDLPLPAQLIPKHILNKLQEGGHQRLEQGLLVDHRGRPLTALRLMKLVRMLAKSFGRFFLSFQNTHPLLGVVIVPAPQDRQQRAFYCREAGRAVAAMTLLSRAWGLVSIIKSGPIEIARDAITCLLAQKTQEAKLRQGLLSGELEPLLIFQVGAPLGPEDIINQGQPDEHNGLAERLLDRRAPRAHLSSHYLPFQ